MDYILTYDAFVLGEYLDKNFGLHYAREIIGLIISYNQKRIRVSLGYNHTCITSNNKFLVCGSNWDGRLGLGNDVECSVLHELNIADITKIKLTAYHSMALTTNPKKIYIWGNNNADHLSSSITCIKYPTELMFEENIKSIGGGAMYSFVLMWTGSLFTWGRSYCASDNNPKCVLSGIKKVYSGANHMFALTESNKYYAWGCNGCGQLGLGHSKNQYQPSELELENILSMSAGVNHSIAIVRSQLGNDIYVFGSNSCGQLGLDNCELTNKPLKLELNSVVSIKCGWDHTVALDSDGIVYIWGQLFDGAEIYVTPTRVMLIERVRSIKTGQNHIVVVSVRDKVYAWGENNYGQLGLGDNLNRSVPTELCLGK